MNTVLLLLVLVVTVAIKRDTKKLLMKNAELANLLKQTKEQLDKAKGEINSKIEALTQAVENADNVPAEVEEAANALKGAAQVLDDIVPDAPTEPTEPPANP